MELIQFNYGQKSGKDYGWRQNFYHKPIASLNWDYNIDDNLDFKCCSIWFLW